MSTIPAGAVNRPHAWYNNRGFPDAQAPVISERARLVTASYVLADALSTCAAFVVAHAARAAVSDTHAALGPVYPLRDYLPLLGFIVPIWFLTFHVAGLYGRRASQALGTEVARLLRALAVAALLLFTILVQYGINLYAARVAEAAAREGAQAAAHWDGTSGDGSSTAKEYVTQDGSPAVRGSTVSASRSGTEARVTVTVQVASVLPWMDDPITSTATAPVERWTQ